MPLPCEVLVILCWAQMLLPQAPRAPSPQTVILGPLCPLTLQVLSVKLVKSFYHSVATCDLGRDCREGLNSLPSSSSTRGQEERCSLPVALLLAEMAWAHQSLCPCVGSERLLFSNLQGLGGFDVTLRVSVPRWIFISKISTCAGAQGHLGYRSSTLTLVWSARGKDKRGHWKSGPSIFLPCGYELDTIPGTSLLRQGGNHVTWPLHGPCTTSVCLAEVCRG